MLTYVCFTRYVCNITFYKLHFFPHSGWCGFWINLSDFYFKLRLFFNFILCIVMCDVEKSVDVISEIIQGHKTVCGL